MLESRAVAAPGAARRGGPDAGRWSKLAATDTEVYGQEWFGPISFVIATDCTAHSIEIMRATVGESGRADRRRLLHRRGGAGRTPRPPRSTSGCTCRANLTGGVFVNQLLRPLPDFHGMRC